MYQTVAELLSQGLPPNRLWWLRLDHPLLMERNLGDWISHIVRVSKATAAEPAIVFLDEVNYADAWDLWLKTFYDERHPVRIAATSSSTAALRNRHAESGVGRWEEQFLSPYLFSEYLALNDALPENRTEATLAQTIECAVSESVSLPSLDSHRRRFLLVGGFPELIAAPASDDEASDILRSQQTLRADAVQRAVCMDIPQAFNINEPIKLERLLYILGGQIAEIFSPTSLASDLSLTAATVYQYLDYLERAFLVFSLQNYSASEETIQRRGKKIYFVDGAVRNAALQRGIAPLRDQSEMGHLIENACAAHLHSLGLQSGVRVFHWRDRVSGVVREVDLVYDHPTEPLAFEISVGARHRLDGLRAFQSRFPKFNGRCYLVSPSTALHAPEEDHAGIGRLPIDLYLILTGAQAQADMERRLGV
ncbi:MAG: ATP-binding protein [Phycisphaeraceae bacterium]|nr:MAG: ATP-binding protein [Phycisphaeraceae bacterium]